MRSLLRIAGATLIAASLASPATFIYKTADRDLKLDVTYPEGWKAADRRTLIVFYYNGGWGNGTPERQFDDQARYFTQLGAVTARADYRVKNRDGVETPRKCIEDVLSAIRWVRKNAASLGIDPGRVVSAGGSGSAHLVAGAGYATDSGEIPNAMFVYHPDADDLTPEMVRHMLTAETARRMPPTVVFIGSRDPMVGLTSDWTGQLKRLGAPVELFVGEGGIHGFYKFSPWLEKTTLRADALLRRHGFLGEQPRADPPTLPRPAAYGKRTEQNQTRWQERHRSRSDPPQAEYVYQTYGERKLKIVFHYPEGWSRADRRPVILFLSGGAHNPRDKDGNLYPMAAERASKGMPVENRGPADAFSTESDSFAQRGMVAARVEYRQRKEDGVLPDESSRDAAHAIRWVRKNAGKLGVDPDRLVAAGGSGGAHLVAAVAALPSLHGIGGTRPDAMILHFPLLDWVEGGAMTPKLKDALNNDAELAERLSPARHWSKDMPPTLVFIGSKEPTFEVNRAFVEKWKAAGAAIDVFIGEEAPHGFSTKPLWREKATARSDQFLKALGYVR